MVYFSNFKRYINNVNCKNVHKMIDNLNTYIFFSMKTEKFKIIFFILFLYPKIPNRKKITVSLLFILQNFDLNTSKNQSYRASNVVTIFTLPNNLKRKFRDPVSNCVAKWNKSQYFTIILWFLEVFKPYLLGMNYIAIVIIFVIEHLW